MDFETALAIVTGRLGRDLNPQEVTDLRTVLAAGATEEQLRSETLNASQDGGPLFPEFAAPERPLVGQEPPAPGEIPAGFPGAPAPPATAVFDPSASYSADLGPLQAFDPFGLDTAFSESSFITAPEAPPEPLAEPDPQALKFQALTPTQPPHAVTEPQPTPAETAQVGRFFNEVARWGKQKVRNLQQLLFKAGYFESVGEFRPGFADEATLTALRFAVLDSQRREEDLPSTLEAAAAAFKRQEARADRLSARAEAESFAEQLQDQYRNELSAVYFSEWGKPPPPKYINNIAASGMNIFEFRAHERAKPAWESSPRFHEERLGLEAQLAQVFGATG